MSVFVTKEQRRARMEICRACPHLKALTQCDKCGCIMTAKTLLAGQACPEGKWQAIIIERKD